MQSIDVWDTEQPKAFANAPLEWNAVDCATAAGPQNISVSSSVSAVVSDVAAHFSTRSKSSLCIGNSSRDPIIGGKVTRARRCGSVWLTRGNAVQPWALAV